MAIIIEDPFQLGLEVIYEVHGLGGGGNYTLTHICSDWGQVLEAVSANEISTNYRESIVVEETTIRERKDTSDGE